VSQPLVGVIVPCFNQGRFAAECIASIEAQTYSNVRVVVVNDASTDDSAALLDALASDRVHIVHLQRNLGRALVRNEAVRRLGDDVDFILNVDCDDRLSPDYAARLVAALRVDAEAGLAYGTLHSFGDLRETAQTTWPTQEYVHEERFLDNRIPGPGVLFRAAALRETEGWRAAFAPTGNEDVDLWLQVVERGWRPVWVRDAVYHYRHHGSSFLSTRSEANRAASAVTVLAHHRAGIDETIGSRLFLEREVMPWLRGALRDGHFRDVAPVLGRLLRIAPLVTLRALGGYYAKRLSRKA
jgi:glycosyltransferase involved in cell wall biosynthesis